jgi:hypothetical protein
MYSIARNTDSLGKEFDYTRMSKEGKHFNSIFKPEKLYREAMEKITNELGDEILNYEKWEA